MHSQKQKMKPHNKMTDELTHLKSNSVTEEELMKRLHQSLPSVMARVKHEAIPSPQSHKTAIDYERNRNIHFQNLVIEKTERDYENEEIQNNREFKLKLIGLISIALLVVVLGLITVSMSMFGMKFNWFTVGLFIVFGGFAASIAAIVTR